MKKKRNLDDVNAFISAIVKKAEETNVKVTSVITKRLGDMLNSSKKASVSEQFKRTNDDLAEIEHLLFEYQQYATIMINQVIAMSAEMSYNKTKDTLDNYSKQQQPALPKAIPSTTQLPQQLIPQSAYTGEAYEEQQPILKSPELPQISTNAPVVQIIGDTQKNAVQAFLSEYRTQAFMLRDSNGNLIPTKASEAYQRAIDKAALAIRSGSNAEQIIRQTVQELSASGLRVVVGNTDKVTYVDKKFRYHTQRLDTAVRRNVLDSVRLMEQHLQEEVGKQIDADGVELSAHFNPAKDHEQAQGHQYYLSEFEKMQSGEDFTDVKGNEYEGFERSIGIWNCRHFVTFIIVGVFEQTYSDDELKKIIEDNHAGYVLPNGKRITMYECTQRQRTLETKIRYAKEDKIAADNAGLADVSAKAKARVTELIRIYYSFSADCGLKVKPENIYVYGYKSK